MLNKKPFLPFLITLYFSQSIKEDVLILHMLMELFAAKGDQIPYVKILMKYYQRVISGTTKESSEVQSIKSKSESG